MPAVRSFAPSETRSQVAVTIPEFNNASSGTNELSSKAQDLMAGSVCNATRVRKKRYVNAFLQWATSVKLTAGDVYPPSEPILCNYASTFAGLVAGGTARAYLSAVKSWVLGKGLQWFGNNRLRKVLDGVERNAPASSFKEERAPIKVEHLRILHHELDLSGDSPFDSCISAVANTLFFAQMRAGEALGTSPNISKFEPGTHPTVGSLVNSSEPGSFILHLPSTKTSQNRGEKVIISSQDNPVSPTHAIRDHITISGLRAENPLFSYRLPSGLLALMTKQRFLKRINGILAKHNLPEFKGHCFRIGGTTHYLLSGMEPQVVKALGRWKSDAFLKYWRNLDSLASMHLHRVHAQQFYHGISANATPC